MDSFKEIMTRIVDDRVTGFDELTLDTGLFWWSVIFWYELIKNWCLWGCLYAYENIAVLLR